MFSPDRLPARDRTRPTAPWLQALLLVLLVWIQTVAPFVHAHAGASSRGGWHLHGVSTGIASPLPPSAETVATPAGLARDIRPPETPEVGLAPGVPNSRAHDIVADTDRLTSPGIPPTAPRLDDVSVRRIDAAREPGHGHARHRPGLPALAHAPPLLSR